MKKLIILILSTFLFITCGKTSEKAEKKIIDTANYKNYVVLYNKLIFDGVPFSEAYSNFFDRDQNYIGITAENYNQLSLEKIKEQYLPYDIIFKNIQENMKKAAIYNVEKRIKQIIELSDSSENKLIELTNYLYDKNIKNVAEIETLNKNFLEIFEKNVENLYYFMGELEEVAIVNQKELIEKMKQNGSTIEEKIETFKLAARIFISAFYEVEIFLDLDSDHEILINLQNLYYLLAMAKEDVDNEFLKYEEANNYRDIFLNYFENLLKISQNLMLYMENGIKNKEDIDRITERIDLFLEIYNRGTENRLNSTEAV